MGLFQKSVVNKYLKQLEKADIEAGYKKFTDYFHNPETQENIRALNEEQFQQKFLIELFVKILGYTINPDPEYNLTTEFKNEKGAKKADGAILNESKKAIGVIELKGTDTKDLDKVNKQAFNYKNNHTKCVYVITSNFEKLRFFIHDSVNQEDFNLFNLSENEFKLLWLCLHKNSLLADIPKKIKKESVIEEEKITEKLYLDYSEFKREMWQNMVKLNPQHDELLLFKKSQKLLDRFLFIFFSEDKGLLPPNSITEIIKQWKKLKELDEYRPLYDRYKKYFGYMNDGFKGQKYEIHAYNGGLFKEDKLLDSLSIDDEVLRKHTMTLTEYDFESEIDVNILGHIFEHSLSEIENVRAKLEGVEVEKAKTKRKKDGVFYTPKYITKYIVQSTVGRLCEEKKLALNVTDERYKKAGKRSKKGIADIEEYRRWLLDITICDPACGSGAFLSQALEFLINEHSWLDELNAAYHPGSIVFPDVEKHILENNLYGVDINEESVEIAKLALWLHTAQKGRTLTTLSENIKCGNSLINDAAVAGDDAFNWESNFSKVFNEGGFDVIVGNPPYAGRSSSINEAEKEFVRGTFESCEGKFELYQLFIEKCFKLVKDTGSYISLITPQTWLSIIQAKKLRKIVLANKELSEIVFLGKDVFEDASVDTIIFTVNVGNKNDKISFLQSDQLLNDRGTQSSIKYNSIDKTNLIIPIGTDEKGSKIVQKISNDCSTLEEIGSWSDGVKIVGEAKNFAFQRNKQDDSFYPMFVGKDIMRYGLKWGGLYCCRDKEKIERHNATDIRLRDENMFKRKKILIRKTGSQIVAAYDSSEYYYEQSLFSYGVDDEEKYSLKFIIAILNSRLANYLLEANAFSKKDTFPQIRLHWLKEFPIKKLDSSKQKPFIDKVDSIRQTMDELRNTQYSMTQLLESKFDNVKLSKKLQNWPELEFKEFLKELKKNRAGLSLAEEAEWMQYFNGQQKKILAHQAEIDKYDKELNALVFALYGLSQDEVKIIEE